MSGNSKSDATKNSNVNALHEGRKVLVNGHYVRYIVFSKGEDVVFLHGWGASASAFLFVAKRISDKFRVTLFDFAGFGESEEPEIPYSVEDYAAETVALMAHVGIRTATLVCHSFGGRVGMEIAAKYPNLVKKLVLIDSAGMKPRRGLKYHIRVGVHKLLKRFGGKGLRGSHDYRMLSPKMKETFKKVVNYRQEYLLKRINCPVAVFWGRKDKETPPYMARRIKRGIADCEIFWLDGGHFAYADDFCGFYPVLRAFLEG